MAATTIPDTAHDLAEAIAKSSRVKGLEIADAPSGDYSRIRRADKTLAYVMIRGARKAGEKGGGEAATAKPVKDPVALHHSGRIHRYPDVKSAAEALKKLATAE